ncbi:uncharacterized protein FIBRA_06967 [Fibroporia radiculosa]|uniref:Yeast cell wall synthesis Kre9/Knh1-like N-terminal domain-containing protein n=1 Tax=Fibroporia radiculosa TaxID=599839 RepID=J4IBJ6_9APHY|nr:uncharacterized protein FIBRA_06967 [Fibroporia radiculosa]CCM04776.1 predicted protein [Fibroporia radiculosa]
MFFTKLSVVCSIVSLASALIINTPSTPWYSDEEVTITWQNQNTEEPSVFSFLLTSSAVGGDSYAIADDVSPVSGHLTVTLPNVQSGSYVLEAVNVTDVNDVYAESASFEVL